jgi:NAD(P)-dependent dehydrogenase (short-subunit alcohol dehydrogenase family)
MATNGRVAVVTGAGSGIGKACALALFKDGYRVVLAGRRRDVLEQTAREAGADEGKVALVAPTDVTDPVAVRGLFELARQAYGRVDVLFNNAGINPGGPIEDLTDELWKSVVDINVNGAFYCAREAFRTMKAQNPRGGRIINNGSIAAHAPRPNTVPYTVTKHAITGLTKSLSLDGRQYDIACSQIDIGNAASAMGQRFTKGVVQADGSIKPEPNMDLKHVADAVLFMANLPLEANVQFMTIVATKMPFIGRG